jgi:hypothetical protein
MAGIGRRKKRRMPGSATPPWSNDDNGLEDIENIIDEHIAGHNPVFPVAKIPRHMFKERNEIGRLMWSLKMQHENKELTTDSLGRKLGEILAWAMGTEGHKQLTLVCLLEESGFDSQVFLGNKKAREEGDELEEMGLESQEAVVATPFKKAPVAKAPDATLARAVSCDANI